MSWHVLLTEPNREATAARHLKFLGCSSYLPMLARAHRQRMSGGGRRWRVYRRPLMPGYLFIDVNDVTPWWSLIRMTAGIRKCNCPFLANDGRLAVIQSEKIREIERLEIEINRRRSRRMRFRLGDRVLVLDGVFTGLCATVYQLTDNARVQLLLDFLGQKSKVHVAAEQIELAA